ncbi:hypothetical protein Ancab_039306 [Ancistrocladus abbreviatus]
MALCEESGDIAIAEGGGGRQLAVEESIRLFLIAELSFMSMQKLFFTVFAKGTGDNLLHLAIGGIFMATSISRGYSSGVGGYGSHFGVTTGARATYGGACAGLYGNNARYHSYAR